MLYRQASEFPDTIRRDMSRIFVEGFKQWLVYFSKDERKLAAALEHAFVLEHFTIATADGDQPAAMAACIRDGERAILLNPKELRRHLGFLRGSLAAAVLKGELENHKYPFRLSQSIGSLEFVATAPLYRGWGAASGLLRHIMETTPFDSYILEVASSNTPAIRLYEKLGFAEFRRVEQKHKKQSGFDYYLYMRHDKIQADE